MDESPIAEVADPEDAFSMLADETRIEILRALWEATDHTATFSELREAVGVRDSGQFNYHLGKLTDRFVRKTDAGYQLRAAGRHVVGALLSGAYTMDGAVDGLDLDDPCPLCGETLTFGYEDDRARITCEGCVFETALDVPPGAFADYPTEAFPDVTDRYLRTLLTHARNEFCWLCDGRVDLEVGTDDLAELPPPADDLVMVSAECDRCGSSTRLNLATFLLDHPAVVAFHDDHGIDVRTLELWKLGSHAGLPRSTLRDDDPVAAAVTYTLGDETLTLSVDDTLEVVSVERESV